MLCDRPHRSLHQRLSCMGAAADQPDEGPFTAEYRDYSVSKTVVRLHSLQEGGEHRVFEKHYFRWSLATPERLLDRCWMTRTSSYR